MLNISTAFSSLVAYASGEAFNYPQMLDSIEAPIEKS